jgi:tetratricopeptide (TPR) repeat protein
MHSPTLIFRPAILLTACFLLLPAVGNGQVPQSIGGSLAVIVLGPDGGPFDQMAQAELSNSAGQLYQQATTRGGRAEFTSVGPGGFVLTVVAAGYLKASEQLQLLPGEASIVTVRMQPISNGKPVASPIGPPILAPNLKKELGKAVKEMQSGRLKEARSHLDAAYRLAPGNPEVNYIFGLYFVRVNDWGNAKSHLETVLRLDPKYLGALLSLGTISLRENDTAKAISYFKKATEAVPSSWRAHALLADAHMRQGAVDEGVVEAERAAQLGQAQAPIVQPLLARALAKRGDTDRAVQVLEKYLQLYPTDTAATQQLAELKIRAPVANDTLAPASLDSSLPLPRLIAQLALPAPPSIWLPTDVDDWVPPVEPGVACDVNRVVDSAGTRVQEFVSNVERFTATELVTHETINKWGIASAPEKYKFNYLVSIREWGPGLLNVDEFRPRNPSPKNFPDGVQRSGLPALMLIFHPYYAQNFQMVCEGLARWNGHSAWQVHFQQRSDRPNNIRDYRFGATGKSYSVALKGRAWIDADSFQILRLETDLVTPLREIRLVADHAAVEYGPVNFQARSTELWLPQSAEFYYDWMGHRGHRVHHFQDYLLFFVTDREKVFTPKIDNASNKLFGSGTTPER